MVTGEPTSAGKTMAHLQKATERWKAFQAAVAQHASDSIGERHRDDTEQTHSTEWYHEQEAKKGP